MTPRTCPNCSVPVHPLLGDAPLVLGDRVVMCCSEACRDMVRDGLMPRESLQSAEFLEGDDDVMGEVRGPEPTPLPAAVDDGLKKSRPGLMVSGVAVETPPPAESRRRQVLLATLVGGGALLLMFAGYLILSSASRGGGAKGGASLSTTLSNVYTSPAPEAPAGALDARAVEPAKNTEPPTVPPRPSLMTLKKRSWSILEGFLASRTGRFWRTAARVLAEQGHAGALAALRKALKSDSWANRQRAAEALARLGHSEGIDALKKDLTARRRPIKWASAFALARCGSPAGLRVIKQLARYRQHRMTSYEALVRLGDADVMVRLREVLGSRAKYDRLRAAVALGMKGDRSGLGVLQARMKEPGMHMGVALALQKLGAPAARPALIRALKHTALREEAARALRAYGDVTLVAKMGPELSSNSEDVRLTAAAAIVILTAQARAEAQ